MSAGPFLKRGYEANDGKMFPIRIQPETITLDIAGNVNTAGALAGEPGLPSVDVGKSRRSNGVHARLVRFKFTGTPPAGYTPNSTLTLPILKPETYNALSDGATGTYTLLGQSHAIEYVGKTPEKIK